MSDKCLLCKTEKTLDKLRLSESAEASVPEAQNIEGGLLKIQFQEVVGPIYFMAIIIILKLTLKSPYMEAVLDPPGSSNVNYTAPLRG